MTCGECVCVCVFVCVCVCVSECVYMYAHSTSVAAVQQSFCINRSVLLDMIATCSVRNSLNNSDLKMELKYCCHI